MKRSPASGQRRRRSSVSSQIAVGAPDMQGRTDILKVHARGKPLEPSVDLEAVARRTPGFTGADLANLCNEAALAATRRGGDAVTLDDFTLAVERIVAGLEKKNRVLSSAEREIVAHHEVGHALAAMALPGSDPVHKISIIPRGVAALGYTVDRREGVTDIHDPRRLNPELVFQELDASDTARRQQRNRLHVELTVPADHAPMRVAAIVAAGGRVLDESQDRWRVADPEGNELVIIAGG